MRSDKLMAWSGVPLMVLFLLGFWVIAGFVPPPSPHEPAIQIARFYQHSETAIHLGLWMTMLSAALVAPWAVAISHQLKRIEGRSTPLADAQLVLGALLVLEFIIPLMLWQAADFRPMESIITTQRFNDIGWLMFVGVVSTGTLEAIVIAVAILQDRSATPVLPRWLGYANLWIAFLFMPAGLCVCFKTGPLAWNGIISWWLLLTAFSVWVLLMTIMVLRAGGQPQQPDRHPARIPEPVNAT